jgi:hypothetical protein
MHNRAPLLQTSPSSAPDSDRIVARSLVAQLTPFAEQSLELSMTLDLMGAASAQLVVGATLLLGIRDQLGLLSVPLRCVALDEQHTWGAFSVDPAHVVRLARCLNLD